MSFSSVWSPCVLCTARSALPRRHQGQLCCPSLGTHRWVSPGAWLLSAHSLASHSQPPDVTPRKINPVHAPESSNAQTDFSAVLCSWFYKSPLLPLTACSVTVLAPASALLRLSIFLSCHGYVSHLICDLLSWVRVIVELCASRPLVTQLKLA